MLIVIAIVGILAGILMPVLFNARKKARQVNCQSNLRAIGVALKNYFSDEKEYPPPYDPVTGNGGVNALYDAGLIDSREVLICKDDHITVDQ